MVTAALKFKDTCFLKESYDKPREHIKKAEISLCRQSIVNAMVFPIVMYGYERWTIKKTEHGRIDAFELRYWRRHWDCKEIKTVNPKGNQSWIFIERTDAEAEAPILWPPDVKNWLTGKDPDAGKDWHNWATEQHLSKLQNSPPRPSNIPCCLSSLLISTALI